MLLRLHSCFLKQPQNHVWVLNVEAVFPLSRILEAPDNQQLFRLNCSKWGCFPLGAWTCLECRFGYLCKKALAWGFISAQASLFHKGKNEEKLEGVKTLFSHKHGKSEIISHYFQFSWGKSGITTVKLAGWLYSCCCNKVLSATEKASGFWWLLVLEGGF